MHGLTPRLPPKPRFLTQGPQTEFVGSLNFDRKKRLYFSPKSNRNLAFLLAMNWSQATVVNICVLCDRVSGCYLDSALHCYLIHPKILLVNLWIKQHMSFSEKGFVDLPGLSVGSMAQESQNWCLGRLHRDSDVWFPLKEQVKENIPIRTTNCGGRHIGLKTGPVLERWSTEIPSRSKTSPSLSFPLVK